MREIISVLIVVIIALWLLQGCASTVTLDPNYVAYLEAKKIQPKIVEMIARPGESISMTGLERLTIYGESLEVYPDEIYEQLYKTGRVPID